VIRAAICIALVAAGCSSLVSDPCIDGFHLVNNACQPGSKAKDMPTAGMDVPDAGGRTVTVMDAITPDAMVCELPTTNCGGTCVTLDSDPVNCGHCGRVCASGICTAGACVGEVPGNIVVIGHDYAAADPAMDRVIANGVSLGTSAETVRVGWWRGTAAQEAGQAAVQRGLGQTGRGTSSTTISTIATDALADLDAVVIEPQLGDGTAAEQAGAQAAAALAQFLTAGHAVVVLETTSGVSYRFLHGAGLVDLAVPVDASGVQVTVVAFGDAVAQGVVSPYLAKPSSVGFPGAAHAVVRDAAGDAVVIHATY
jgi:hypothetical protein